MLFTVYEKKQVSKLHQFICMHVYECVLIIHMAKNKLIKLYMIHFLRFFHIKVIYPHK